MNCGKQLFRFSQGRINRFNLRRVSRIFYTRSLKVSSSLRKLLIELLCKVYREAFASLQ